MTNLKWVVYAVAAGMMAATALWLQEFKKQPRLGSAGVRVVQTPIYNEKHDLAADHSVPLPATVLDIPSIALPVTTVELDALPKDTTFGRRFYHASNDTFAAQLTVVLMGTDHTSIHQPQYCLYSQDWAITNTERVSIPMARPYADIPAVKMIATQQSPTGETRNCLYVYWFVSGDKITAEEGSRLWSMWKTVVQKGVMERWAYVSYFVPCIPGDEQVNFERLKKFIRASVPEFQLVTGQPPGTLSPLAAQK